MDFSNLTQQERAALGKNLADVLWWSENFLIEPDNLQPYRANTVQKLMYAAQKSHKHIVIRVHRRAGKTVGLSVISLHAATINRGYEILVVAPDQGKVAEIFSQIRAYISVNPSLQSSIINDGKSPENITFKNGSSIKGKTTGSAGKSGGKGLRGKGADLVIIDECAYLMDEDYMALNPIIMGDIYRRHGVQVFAASTPTADQNRYFEWCTNKEKGWHEIYMPITENPDWSTERAEEIHTYVSEMEWDQEYMAAFPSLGENAIRKEDIAACQFDFQYSTKTPMTVRPRVMGVDWDKFQAGVNVAVVELDTLMGTHRIIYREEMPRSTYSLVHACDRVIALNRIFSPDFIFCDRGYNEMGVETLQKYGVDHPETFMDKRVIGVSFSEHVEIIDPVTGQINKKRFKGVMANRMFKLIEDRRLEIPKTDKEFEKQLINYKVISVSESSFKTASKKEHIFDAVGLACWGLFHKFANTFKRNPARESRVVEMPKIVKTREARQREKAVFAGQGTAITDRTVKQSWARGTFSSQPIKRSSF